ncbi:hypothetical protein Q5741_01980 [Paenibacillus sp. JX-17]|uniref:DUF2207 domain-containing protein n=1 Tax=Paenibacillus lacisoli TaxID=3064525 RepID=A0ABT9C7D9_9BACL|nr:hypothetical protein [Paenibacillus sp. JX-17]MDO7905182.1 hypothetical protein [Paenibacillus sp. JX-17]
MIRQAVIFWGSIILAVIGLIDSPQFLTTLIIPVVLLAVVFLLYKYPPSRGRSKQPKVKPSARTMAKVAESRKTSSSASKRRKEYPFYVIEGHKGKQEDDNIPKYH